MDLNFDDFNFGAMPQDGDAAGWVAWFGNALQALIKLITGLFNKLTGKEEGTTAAATE